MNPIAGTVVAERFRLERPLGLGGMGAVWLAHHVSLRIPCAVKFIHAHAAEAPAVRARFEREAVAAAQLRSPNVVQILDHGVWEGVPYIAMELLEGEDLAHRITRRRGLPPYEVLAIVTQVARALTKAHAIGLVHRDLKPANVFLVQDDDREIAKILDFGIAKTEAFLATDGSTKTGSLLGTPFYMSPEQAQGSKNVDHRSDLWALGVVTFECLTGVRPFAAEALGEVFMRIMVRPLPVPSEMAALPPSLDAWWFKAVSRDPATRFQSARELSDALGPALGLTAADPAELVARPSLPGGAPPFRAAASPVTPANLTGTPSGVAIGSTPAPLVASTPAPAPTPGPAVAPPMAIAGIVAPATLPLHAPSGLSGSLEASSAPSVHKAGPSRAGVVATAVGAALLLGGAAFLAYSASAPRSAPTQAAQVDTTAPAAPEPAKPPAQAVAPSAAVVVEPAPPPSASARAAVTGEAKPRPPAQASPGAAAAAHPNPTAVPAAKPAGRTRDLGF